MSTLVSPEAGVVNVDGTAVEVTGIATGTRVRLDGECLRETLARLEQDIPGRRLSREALGPIVDQASRIILSMIESYDHAIGSGEVGADASARAAATPPAGADCPTGLLYGLVQSGKTAAMIATSALAIDNGFRIIVVLTANNVRLVHQTTQRFEALEGPLVFSSNMKTGGEYDWEADRTNIEQSLPSRGVVFICGKERNHQLALIRFLQDIGAADFPAIVFDDEADQGTPDTTLAARSQQRPNAPTQASTTYRRTVENDAPLEAGQSFREVLRHNLFIQVTATPYGLLLQNLESPLRPEFTEVVEPGEGYRGGDTFFGHVDDLAEPPLRYVAEQEATVLAHGLADAPEGLATSIAFFLLAATAHAAANGGFPAEGYKHLSHTSPNTVHHDHVSQLIRQYTDRLQVDLEAGIAGVVGRAEFIAAYAELQRSAGAVPPLHELVATIARRNARRRIITVNANGSDTSFGPYFNFMVGGNILGRGLTIDDLLVTYYLRRPITTQMDTMLQHARMYGYRTPLMPYTRVFLPYTLALRFRSIHESEEALRGALTADPTSRGVSIEVVNNLRPTRPGILDTGSIAAYRPAQQLYPMAPVFEPELLGHSTQMITELVTAAFGGTLVPNEFRRVRIEKILEIIGAVAVRPDDPSDWDSTTARKVLEAIAEAYGNEGAIYYRPFHSSRRILPTGTMFGGEVTDARNLNIPVLSIMRESGTRPAGEANPWAGAPFYVPTIVFPGTMRNHVFNSSR